MHQRFLPGSGRDAKTGLEKHHKLMKSKSRGNFDDAEKTKSALPGNWMYNEAKAEQVWSELEDVEPKQFEDPLPPTSPLRKIEDSTSRIKQTIKDFEVDDQQFLLRLAELMGDDNFVDGAEGADTLLLDARAQLQSMIDEHVDYSEKQSQILDTMKAWLRNIRLQKDDPEDHDRYEDEQEQILKMKKLLDEYMKDKDGMLEQVGELHQDMIQNLHGQVSDCQRIISQKDMAISQMSQEPTINPSLRRRGVRGVRLDPNSPDYEDALSRSQRQVLELQNQLNRLKVSLGEITETPDYTKQSGKDESANTATGFPEDLSISIRKEIEFDTKLKVLQDQLLNLKEDNKYLRDLMLKQKQSELEMTKKMQVLERIKRSTEASLNSTTKKLQVMREGYERQVSELKEALAKGFEIQGESNVDVVNRYEKKIAEMVEEFRQQVTTLQETLDRKYKAQMRDVLASCNKSDVLKAFDETMQKYNDQAQEQKELNEKMMKQMKDDAARQLMEVSRHYEVLLKRKEFEIERVRDSVDSEVRNRMLGVRMDYEEKTNARVLAAQEEATAQFATIKHELEAKVEVLTQKLNDVTRERDGLKAIIDANDIAAEMMDDVVLDADDGHAQTDENEDVLQKSLDALKEQEIEQKLTEKYALILKAQKEMLADSAKWNLEQAKAFYKKQFDASLSEFRQMMANRIHAIYDSCPADAPELQTLLTDTLAVVQEQAEKEENVSDEPTVPLHEVEARMNAIKEKLLTLLQDRGVWTNTIKKLGDLQGKSEEDIIDAIKHAIWLQTEQYVAIEKENRELRRKMKLSSASASQTNLLEDVTEHEEEKAKSKKSALKTDTVFDEEPNAVCCFHCKNEFVPDEVKTQVAEVDVCRCPQCSHITLMKQSKDIDDLTFGPQARPFELEEESTQRGAKQGITSQPSELEISLRMQLEESTTANQKLQKRLELSKKRLIDLESQYIKQIDSLSNEIAQLRKNVVGSSLNVVKDARSLPSSPEFLASKVMTSKEVSRTVAEMQENIKSPDTKAAIVKLSKATVALQDGGTCADADNVLDQTKEVLQMIAKETQCFNADMESSNTMLGMKNRIRIDVAKADVAKMKGEITKVKETFVDFQESQQSMLKTLGSAAKGLIEMTKAVKITSNRTIDDMETVIDSRTHALGAAEDAIRRQQAVIDDLQNSLRATLMQIQKLSIEKSERDDETNAFIKSQLQSSEQIDELIKRMTEANQQIMHYKREADDLKTAWALSKNKELIASARTHTSLNSDDGVSFEVPNQSVPVLNFVKPFIVFTTSQVVPPLTVRGFSLLPRKAVVCRSEEKFAVPDLDSLPETKKRMVNMSPSMPLKTHVLNIPATPDGQAIIEESPLSKVIQKNSGETVIHATPPETPESQKVRVRVAAKTNSPFKVVVPKAGGQKVKHEPQTPQQQPMTRTLSFENLVPISDNELQGTLIGYVTRYVREPTGGGYETPKPRRVMSPSLAPSPVLISEVPTDRLVAKDSEKTPRTKADWVNEFEKRMKVLEKQLSDQNETLQREREKGVKLSKANLVLKTELAKVVRAEKKSVILHEATKKRLAQALALVSENDKEVIRLKKLLREIGTVANSITVREKMGTPSRERRKQQIEKTYQNESQRILAVFQGVTTGIHSMAQHEIEAVRRWTPKRDQFILEERNKLMAALEAMQLVSKHENTERGNPIIVTSTKKIAHERRSRSQLSSARKLPPMDPISEIPTPDKATIMASSHNQDVPAALLRGVVGKT